MNFKFRTAVHHPGGRSVFRKCLLRFIAPFLTLSACQSVEPAVIFSSSSLAGMPIAFDSIEGPPQAAKTALSQELASAANARKVELVGTGAAARYRMRGYLTTEPAADGGTALAFVWDVFDNDRRTRRLTGEALSTSSDPWSDLDRSTIKILASRSMDEIVGFLSKQENENGLKTEPAGKPAQAEYESQSTE